MFQAAKPIFIKGKATDLNTFAAFRTVVGAGKGMELRITAISFYQVRVKVVKALIPFGCFHRI